MHAANDAQYFHPDALGSARTLTDTAGAVTDSYRFKAFGEMQAHVGTNDQPFLFAGEQLDRETENYYLRARSYSPATARFVQRDTVSTPEINSTSPNRYHYSLNDPVGNSDPSGRTSMAEVNIAMAGLSGLAVAANAQLQNVLSVIGSSGSEISDMRDPFSNPVFTLWVTGSVQTILNRRRAATTADQTVAIDSNWNLDDEPGNKHHTVPVYMCGQDREQELATVRVADHGLMHAQMRAHEFVMEDALLEFLQGSGASFIGNQFFGYSRNNLKAIKKLAQHEAGREFIVDNLGVIYVGFGWFKKYPNMESVFGRESRAYVGGLSVKPAEACGRSP